MRSLFLASFVLLIGVSTTQGKPTFPSFIPNGEINSCSNCHSGIPFAGNPSLGSFGYTVAATGTPPKWDLLCPGDSDGDGASNGLELGDPDCLWTKGDPDPGSPNEVSLPGVAGSVPPGFGSSDPDTGGGEDTGGPADAGGTEADVSETEDIALDDFGNDEGSEDPDEGNVEPDEGNVDPDEGNVDPDEGNVDPDEGNVDPDEGTGATDIGAVEDIGSSSTGSNGGGCQSTHYPEGSNLLLGLLLSVGLILRRRFETAV